MKKVGKILKFRERGNGKSVRWSNGKGMWRKVFSLEVIITTSK